MTTAMKGFLYSLTVLGSLCAGLLFYGIYNDHIIIRLPSRGGRRVYEQPVVKRKNAKFFYWHNGKFALEEKMILYSADPQFTLTELITHWLATLDQEYSLGKRVVLEELLLDKSGSEAFLSFNRAPFLPTQSTFEKLMWIESLLKTLKEAGLSVQKVHFFVKSKPLVDNHLDFNHAYPLSGYL